MPDSGRIISSGPVDIVLGYELSLFLSVIGLFAGMVVLGRLGSHVASMRASRTPDGAWEGTAVVDSAVFGLLALLIAFSFSGAMSRLEIRRNLVVEEANAIGTAYQRLDLLPKESQPALRATFRRYLDSRLETYRLLPDDEAALSEFKNSKRLQDEIWNQTLLAARDVQPATMLLIPALNEMFDITATRTINAIYMHPPGIVFAMLFGVALLGAALVGYEMAKGKGRIWLHLSVFAAATSFAIYVILDAEYPRLGLIRVDAIDQALVDLGAAIK